MQSNIINFEKKHKYFNEVYKDLHPSNDSNSRIYIKPKQNFEFTYKDDKLSYSKFRDLDFNKKSLQNFKGIDKDKLDPNQMKVQDKISFYLTSNLVPGFNQDNFNNFSKQKRFQSPELHSRGVYNVDKWYFIRKDDLTAYYEKFFLDKEVEKMRKKNAETKEAK